MKENLDTFHKESRIWKPSVVGSAASTKQLGIGNILGWLCSQGFKGGKNKQCCWKWKKCRSKTNL